MNISAEMDFPMNVIVAGEPDLVMSLLSVRFRETINAISGILNVEFGYAKRLKQSATQNVLRLWNLLKR